MSFPAGPRVHYSVRGTEKWLHSWPRPERLAASLSLMLVYLLAAPFCSIPYMAETAAAAAEHSHKGDKKSFGAEGGVKAVLDMQAAAWNRGDLETFLSGYLNTPDISYVSGSSEVWGYESLRKRYESKYGDKHETMGTLSFSDLKVQSLGSSHALCIGHWHLERSGQPAVEGIFSLVFAYSKSGWKIIHDHTSVSNPPPEPAKTS
jgi:ketosteroid isomerase-like protein